MNRTDRLLGIVLKLQRHHELRAEDLAKAFGTSKRTIYRDIEALCESGVPIAAMTGHGYTLMEGYFLPPLMFSADEATILLLGLESMARSFDTQYQAAAHSATAKIEAALPSQRRSEVDYLRSSLFFHQSNSNETGRVPAILQQLRRAVIERKTVRFRYVARWSANANTEKAKDEKSDLRTVNPYGLVNSNGVWYLVGYDHLRFERRHFRLERMDELTLLRQSFERPATFTFEHAGRDEQRTIVVKLRFQPRVARWVLENLSFFTVEWQQNSDGLDVTLHVRSVEEVLQWVLGWGSQVNVFEPTELRHLVYQEAKKMVENMSPARLV